MKKTIVLGVGNSLRKDDGIGCCVADKLNNLLFKNQILKDLTGLHAINTGPVPENFTSIVREHKPDRVIIIDAADMSLCPGEFRLISQSMLSSISMTTHAMPLSFLVEYLQSFVLDVVVIGVQPEQISDGDQISSNLLTASDKLIEIILSTKDDFNIKML